MVRVNLLPEAVQAAQVRARHMKRWAGAVAVGLGACAIPLVAHFQQHDRIDELRTISDHLQTDLQTARSELKSVSSQANDLILRSERAKALREKRNWSGMFALIASCLPEECWLTSVATDPPQPEGAAGPARKPSAPAAAKPPVSAGATTTVPTPAVTIDAPRKLRILGNAEDPTQPVAFVARLKETRVFRDVLLERTNRQGDDRASIFKFEVLCEW